MKKNVAAKTGSKTQAKKMPAPVKKAAAKTPTAKPKTAAVKTAKTAAVPTKMAAKPSKPVSLAKRLETEGMPALKKQMNKIISVLKADCIAATEGGPAEGCFRAQILALTRTMDSVKKKLGLSFE